MHGAVIKKALPPGVNRPQPVKASNSAGECPDVWMKVNGITFVENRQCPHILDQCGKLSVCTEISNKGGKWSNAMLKKKKKTHTRRQNLRRLFFFSCQFYTFLLKQRNHRLHRRRGTIQPLFMRLPQREDPRMWMSGAWAVRCCSIFHVKSSDASSAQRTIDEGTRSKRVVFLFLKRNVRKSSELKKSNDGRRPPSGNAVAVRCFSWAQNKMS